MKKNLIILGLAILAIFLLLILGQSAPKPNLDLSSFAQCLREKNITMYGAAYCHFCQQEKNLFGGAFKFVPYVECPKQPNECLAKGVNGFPTWIFPDGKKIEGFQSLEKLAEESGCALKAQN